MAASLNPRSYPDVFWDILTQLREGGGAARVELENLDLRRAQSIRSRWFYFRKALYMDGQRSTGTDYKHLAEFVMGTTCAMTRNANGQQATLVFCRTTFDPTYKDLEGAMKVYASGAPAPSAPSTAPSAPPPPSADTNLEPAPVWFNELFPPGRDIRHPKDATTDEKDNNGKEN